MIGGRDKRRVVSYQPKVHRSRRPQWTRSLSLYYPSRVIRVAGNLKRTALFETLRYEAAANDPLRLCRRTVR